MDKINQLLQKIALFLLDVYKYVVSPWVGYNCRFYPTCSVYAREAIIHHGVIYGIWLSFYRLSRCHPLCKGGCDPVPETQDKCGK